jgi:hypothetical protein
METDKEYKSRVADERKPGYTLWKIGGGWTQVLPFTSIKHLIQQLSEKNWRIDKLGILAHGIKGGIQYDRKLTLDSMDSYGQLFKILANHINPSGRIVFFTCVSYAKRASDHFWCKLSDLIPNREIVGFTKQIEFGSMGELDWTGTEAGFVWELGDRKKNRVNEWSSIAKWAMNGYIIKPTRSEVIYLQNLRVKNKRLNPKKLCGSMNCPGHANYGQNCRLYSDIKSKGPSYFRWRTQWDNIIREYDKITKEKSWEDARIPSLLGLVNNKGELILTGRNRPFAFQGPKSYGTQRKRKLGVIK